MRRSACIALTSIMASLALVISVARIEVPFPVLTYLKFDLAEIPSVLTLLLAGPGWSYLCAAIHYMGLLSRSGDFLGPTMKFLAVVSMLAGVGIGRGRPLVMLTMGTLLRVTVTSISNLLVLGFLFPEWLSYAEALLRGVGFNPAGEWEVMLVTLALTAVFNVLHTLLSLIPSWAIAVEARRRVRF